MKYQCPYCNSLDVRKNKLGEVICFECFSVCSLSDDLDIKLNSRAKDAPPPFPVELERSRSKKIFYPRRSLNSQAGVITNVIH